MSRHQNVREARNDALTASDKCHFPDNHRLENLGPLLFFPILPPMCAPCRSRPRDMPRFLGTLLFPYALGWLLVELCASECLSGMRVPCRRSNWTAVILNIYKLTQVKQTFMLLIKHFIRRYTKQRQTSRILLHRSSRQCGGTSPSPCDPSQAWQLLES
jgi:hypothetical protein